MKLMNYILLLFIVILLISIVFIKLLINHNVMDYKLYIHGKLFKPYISYIVNNLKKHNYDFSEINNWEKDYDFYKDDARKYYDNIIYKPEIYIHPSKKEIIFIIFLIRPVNRVGFSEIYFVKIDPENYDSNKHIGYL